jgi:dipeptidyl aminopeptidase/acylaminoacyl peptidase
MIRLARSLHAIAAAAALASPAIAQSREIKVPAISIAAVSKLAEIDLNDVKGQPSRLAWSPEGSQLYFQTLEGEFGKRDGVLRHYVFAAGTGQRSTLQSEPDWAADYWTEKSWKQSPDERPLQIELKSEERVERTTAVPRGGDLARGGTTTATGAGIDDATKAAYNAQRVVTHTMRLHGEIVGQWENTVIVPGLTFGWGPKGSRVIAFTATKSGRVVIMDGDARRVEVAGSKDAVLPAWSPDGQALAWLERDGRRKLVLRVARVSAH